jgi:hypothetical protein
LKIWHIFKLTELFLKVAEFFGATGRKHMVWPGNSVERRAGGWLFVLE